MLAGLTLVIGSMFFTLNNGYLLDSFMFSFLFRHVCWFVLFSFFICLHLFYLLTYFWYALTLIILVDLY